MGDRPSEKAHDEGRTFFRRALILIVVAAIAALVVVRFDGVLAALDAIWGVAAPLFAGAIIAYLINLIMDPLERVFFPNSDSALVRRLRRPVCLIGAIAILVAFVALVVVLVSAEMREALPAIGSGFLRILELLTAWLSSDPTIAALGLSENTTNLATSITSLQDSLLALVEQTGGIENLLETAFIAGKNIATIAVDVLVAVVFSIYLLAGREHAVQGARTFLHWLLPEKAFAETMHIAQVAHRCFSRFIFGQCIEGTILGCLCALGVWILGMPYAASVGLCVGVTSLVPLVGAWVGGIVGALMIFSVEPIQAVWFVIFLVILQQIEGHLIYPNVVGTSVGVPSIWILVAVFVGGTLFGVPGILLGVPTVATCRELIREWRESGKLTDRAGAANEDEHDGHDGKQAAASSPAPDDEAPTDDTPPADAQLASEDAPHDAPETPTSASA